MKRRGFISGLIALAIGVTVGKLVKGRELATGGFYSNALVQWGSPQVHVYGKQITGVFHAGLEGGHVTRIWFDDRLVYNSNDLPRIKYKGECCLSGLRSITWTE